MDFWAVNRFSAPMSAGTNIKPIALRAICGRSIPMKCHTFGTPYSRQYELDVFDGFVVSMMMLVS